MDDTIAETVSQLISRIEDFLAMQSAGDQLARDEYFRWVVPISKLWETVYDSAYGRQGSSFDDLIAGTESEHERGFSVLTATLKKWPFPAIAGLITQQVCLPPFDQNLLRKVFVGMLPQMKVAAGLLATGLLVDKPGPEFSKRTDVRARYFKVWEYLQKPGNAAKSDLEVSKRTDVDKNRVGKIREETRPPTADEIAEERKHAKK
jgi:hypothetical protein